MIKIRVCAFIVLITVSAQASAQSQEHYASPNEVGTGSQLIHGCWLPGNDAIECRLQSGRPRFGGAHGVETTV